MSFTREEIQRLKNGTAGMVTVELRVRVLHELCDMALALDDHNAECVRLCNDRKRCGYEKYAPHMGCSTCPKDWMIQTP